LEEIKAVVKKGYRVLVTTLTKKMAEDLTTHYALLGINVRYLHSDISTLERIEILNDLRKKKFDVLVGINLLREGLDLPEVALVGILDADKEGFLRSKRSLIQIIGRASRNLEGRVIIYADKMTDSIKGAISETDRRREKQKHYNIENKITPKTIKKNITSTLASMTSMDYSDVILEEGKEVAGFKNIEELEGEIQKLSVKMVEHARKLEFEQAAKIRDRISKLKMLRLELG